MYGRQTYSLGLTIQHYHFSFDLKFGLKLFIFSLGILFSILKMFFWMFSMTAFQYSPD